MREIKFRAWDKENAALFYQDKQPKTEYDGQADCLRRWFVDFPEEYEIMQFTGLHDKNGKEIYEGDVLRDHGAVIWHDGFLHWGADRPLMSIIDPEVIGNIYENPELLTSME